MLKWFNKTRYASLGEALGDIYKELQSLQPQDSADIVWSKTGLGMSALRKGATSSNGTPSDSDMTNPSRVDSAGYTSYFKITDASETSEDETTIYKVSIVDGYDRGYNRCKVNNKVYDLKYHTETITKNSLIALRFNASEKEVEYYISEDTKLPDDSSEYSYCQLGTVTIKDSAMTIQQDHLCGIAQMFWYDVCGD